MKFINPKDGHVTNQFDVLASAYSIEHFLDMNLDNEKAKKYKEVIKDLYEDVKALKFKKK